MEFIKKIDKRKMFLMIGIGLGLLVLAAMIYCYYLTSHVLEMSELNKSLGVDLEAVKQERDLLTSENAELKEKVAILSDTVNNKMKEEEELAKAYIPTGFPVKGTATYKEESSLIDEQPAAELEVPQGTSVIAAAKGTVQALEGNAAVGYILMIEHGNGYVTVYRNSSEPMVEVGMEVTTDTELFRIERGHEKLGYQIIEDGVYIDPFSMMEIYG